MKKYIITVIAVTMALAIPIVLTPFPNFAMAETEKQVKYVHADYDRDYSNIDLMEAFDYSFVGVINSKLSTSQYNGIGLNIPYTYFSVDVKQKTKGKISDFITIKFYGGYNNEGELILFDGLDYPRVGEIYKFYCNQTKLNFKDDGRTLDNSYVISMQYNIIKYNMEKNPEQEIELYKISPFPDHTIIDPGSGGATNLSFEKAHEINLDFNFDVYIGTGQELYYKFNNTALKYVSVYSTGDYDAMVYIYDSNHNLVAYNDNVSGRGTALTDKNNFFTNFYADLNSTYYFKIKMVSTADYGTIRINIITDNWYYTTNINDLLNSYNSVDSHYDIDYTNKSKYVSELQAGFNEWNKMGVVAFQEDTIWTNSDVTISDYYDNDVSAVIGVTTHYSSKETTVKFNTYYFDSMTIEQRTKTVLHELGHTLGFKEFTGIETKNNVMHQGILSLTKLGPADIAAYRAKWC